MHKGCLICRNSQSNNLKASLMSWTRSLISDKARCFEPIRTRVIWKLYYKSFYARESLKLKFFKKLSYHIYILFLWKISGDGRKLLVWNHVRCHCYPLQDERELQTILFAYLNLPPFTCTFLRRSYRFAQYILSCQFFILLSLENEDTES